MLRRIFFKKSNNPIKLGRWGTSLKNENDDNSSQNLYLQTDLSNHDHCGSDICGAPSNSEKHKEVENWDEYLKKKKKKKKKKNTEASSSKKDDDDDDDLYYYIPYCL